MLKLIEIKLPLGEEPDDVDRVIGFTTCSKLGLDALITQQSHFFGQNTVSSQKLPVQSADTNVQLDHVLTRPMTHATKKLQLTG